MSNFTGVGFDYLDRAIGTLSIYDDVFNVGIILR